ncbi:MAG: hypothetical protein ACHQ4G_06625 [Opitutales bacterium]
MKNITVTVDDATYHRARVRAAEKQTSVSALVRQHLEQLSAEETQVERLRRLEDETVRRLHRQGVIFRAANRLSREQIHERDALR